MPHTFAQLIPQEERLAVATKQQSLKLGIPKEHSFGEQRICLTPSDVAVLTANEHHILIESGAGKKANFTDRDYSEAGAEIIYDTQDVFACPIILKVAPLTYEEITYLKPNTVVISVLPLNTLTTEYFEALAQKQTTALAFEYIKDEQENYPIRQSISEITGVASVLIAAELLSQESGVLLGNIVGVPPAEVILLGANEITTAAAQTALSLGANVKIFAKSLSDLRKLKQLLPSVFTATLQSSLLKENLKHCNILIGAMRGEKYSPVVITNEMVQLMPRGSVIIDTTIDTGGCIETSQLTSFNNPTFVAHEVLHYGVPNLPSRYAHTASVSLSNVLLPYLLKIGEEGGFENALQADKGFRNGLYLYHGIFTNDTVSQWFDLPYKPLNLLFL